ncbi:SGNH/GDSL hydrolase family protein [Actinomadura logoneensis]|uniref:SGNH/GDSL hydrolase family protein n=1 Tax=Actinomadura logoneensis TaxID=2293572 RepID=A0A372JJV7_9ACTN|nr:SGNH/GDSL hydrolase family protein [Actinomadura logoneensis]RFU40295.1 SGNH/GDSL hydrolase family protein [Actinomadura logoneensis]
MNQTIFRRVRVPVAGAVVLALAGGTATAVARTPDKAATVWTQSWGAAMQRPIAGDEDSGQNWSMEGFAKQTLRQVVRLSSGGTRVRVRISNLYGKNPLKVDAAAVARSAGGAKVWPGSSVRLTFGGRSAPMVRPGAEAVSDPLPFRTAPLEKLAITLRFGAPTGPATFHLFGGRPAFLASGDHLTDVGSAAYAKSTNSTYFLSGVDVSGGRSAGTVVAFGDSLIDGVGSTPGADAALPDLLAERLSGTSRPVAVVNAGIGGNRLRHDSPCAGEKATARFQRDVLDRPGVRVALVHLGANDLRESPGDPCLGNTGPSTARQVIEAQRELVRAAHARGVKVVGATILPMRSALFPVWSPTVEKARVEVNRWIRTSRTFDAVLDVDRAIADPAAPDRPLVAYVYEDGLHPNDAGYQAIARALPGLPR